MFRLIRQLVQKLNKDTKVETQHPSSHNYGKPYVVRSPKVVSTEKKIEEFEESNKKGYGRFVFDENGKVTGVEMVTSPYTNNVLIPTDNKV
jgi:hypothetical protein